VEKEQHGGYPQVVAGAAQPQETEVESRHQKEQENECSREYLVILLAVVGDIDCDCIQEHQQHNGVDDIEKPLPKQDIAQLDDEMRYYATIQRGIKHVLALDDIAEGMDLVSDDIKVGPVVTA
jgi:hypothetical protein